MSEWRVTFVVLVICTQSVIGVSGFGSTVNSQCTLKCTEGDGSATCWGSIMDYFTVDLQRALSAYVSAVGHVTQWRHQHETDDSVLNRDSVLSRDFVVESLHRTLRESGSLSRDDLNTIFNVLLNMTSVDRLRRHDPTATIPPLSCPTPCDYYPRMWTTLFLITLTAFALCCLAFVIHLCRNKRFKKIVKTDDTNQYQPVW